MQMKRRQFLTRALGITTGAGMLGAAGLFYGTRLETEWLDLQRVRIPVRGLSAGLEGFKIALLTDFHLYPHTRLDFIREAVATANSLDPDLVVLGGDYVLRTAESIRDLVPALGKLNARHGIVSVIGNHDLWRGPDLITDTLNKGGMRLLRNRGFVLSHDKAQFYLAGVDDIWAGQPDLQKTLEGAPSGMPVLLLSHPPDPAEAYSQDDRIFLQLSGHSHGGQVRFPGIGSPFLPPHGRIYDLGLYRVRNMWLYTNRGIGVTVPIRINCRPEVTEITLVAP